MPQNDRLLFLQKKFLDYAKVADIEKGYIVVEGFNLAIDPDVLDMASKMWASHYHQMTDLDAVVGLPDAGSRLVSILSDMLRVGHILPAKRSQIVPGAWRNVVSFSNQSFTMDVEDVHSHIGFVKPGMRLLLVDDVVAKGETAMAAIQSLKQAQVEVVGMCVLFDKIWQGGVERIKQETGIEVFSLISVQKITSQGEIILKG